MNDEWMKNTHAHCFFLCSCIQTKVLYKSYLTLFVAMTAIAFCPILHLQCILKEANAKDNNSSSSRKKRWNEIKWTNKPAVSTHTLTMNSFYLHSKYVCAAALLEHTYIHTYYFKLLQRMVVETNYSRDRDREGEKQNDDRFNLDALQWTTLHVNNHLMCACVFFLACLLACLLSE